MKNLISKILVCAAVFIITLFVSSGIYNNGNEEMTAGMSEASMPLVHINAGGIAYNYMYGLRQDIDMSFFRDTITALGEGRTINIVIDKYGNEIDRISFEVRSVDGTRLVENTQVKDYREGAEQIYASVTIKDLIEQETEYNWILKLETGGETIRYYTRIIDGSSMAVREKLAFVQDFHEKTYDSERARELAAYLEPDSTGDNTTYSYVNIHCSLKQVAWGALKVKELTKPRIAINELDRSTASIHLYYIVQTTEGKDAYNYNINEYFRIRYTPDRTYLLDYERRMNQIFEPEADVYASNKIMLGIRDSELQMMESDGGSNLAFVNGKQLFCYHSADKKLAYLFSFADGLDPRTVYENHDIKILNVDETGNVSFIVYGYMNRGSQEGKIGIQVYEYNGMLNTVEELLFIPYDKAYNMLKADMEQLSYLNNKGILYLYLDGSIIAVNLLEKSYSEIASNLQQGSFQVSASDEMLVWQNSADAYDCTGLILMNLNTGSTKEVKAQGSSRMLPLGFINEDLIYGLARYEDITVDSAGLITFPMYVVYIQNEQGSILKSYEHENVYVTGAEITDNLITLFRIEKTESGAYSSLSDDQIVNSMPEETGYNTSELVATQSYEKIVQLVLKNTLDSKTLKHTLPMQVLYEGSRDMEVSIENPTDRYYVYGKDGIAGTFAHEADAINLAYSISGTVVDEEGGYIWKKATRSTKNQIMAITGHSSDDESSSLAVCLETILGFAGSTKNVQPMLNGNMTVKQILEENISGIRVLELRGVSLDAVLYYVDKDIPVLAMLGGSDAVLLTGFNEYNVVLMNPGTGAVYKMGLNDAAKLFQDSGNLFVTYITMD